MMKTNAAKQTNPLIGRAFHTVNEHGQTRWQGVFLADCGNGFVLVQLFDWVAGFPSSQHLIAIADIAKMHDGGWPVFRIFDTLEIANSYVETTARGRDRHVDESTKRNPQAVSGRRQ
jgi:hypothetical protein